MIAITYKHDMFGEEKYIKNVWSVKVNNPKALYLDYMIGRSEKEFGIVINPHWLNIMDWQKCNSHLKESEYIDKSKEWKKFLRRFDIDWYIQEILGGVKQVYVNCN